MLHHGFEKLFIDQLFKIELMPRPSVIRASEKVAHNMIAFPTLSLHLKVPELNLRTTNSNRYSNFNTAPIMASRLFTPGLRQAARFTTSRTFTTTRSLLQETPIAPTAGAVPVAKKPVGAFRGGYV
jgi:hypothetical protein